MSKKISIGILTTLAIVFLSGCCMPHKWEEATCTEPEICTKCGETRGEASGHIWMEVACTEPRICAVCGVAEEKVIGHTWEEATCTEPKTCSVCGATEGTATGHKWVRTTCTEPETCSVCGMVGEKPAGHRWVGATCTKPEECSLCGATQGSALGHTWSEATCLVAKTCNVCGETEGETLGHELNDIHVCERCGEYTGTGTLLDFSDVKVYGKLLFGKYDQDGFYGNGKEDIEWIVLDKQEDKLLVLSKYYLECAVFQAGDSQSIDDINWENSSMRSELLNHTFLYTAFSAAERNAIIDTVIDEPGCGEPTTDKIFLLSYDEYVAYCSEKKEIRQGSKSPRYGEENKYESYPISYVAGWWLRTKLEEEFISFGENVTQQYIPTAGHLTEQLEKVLISPKNYTNSSAHYVRPAMWLPIVMEIEEESSEDAERIPQADLSALHIGERFTFGAYEMNGDYRDGKEPLEWYVLDKKDDSILAISVYGFNSHCGQYAGRNPKEEWLLQNRQGWLDCEFYEEGFSEAEKALMIPRSESKGKSYYNVINEKYNGEYAFMISKIEYEKYFSYAMDIPVCPEGYYTSWALINKAGNVDGWSGIATTDDDHMVGLQGIVRPVISIRIENKEQEEEAGTRVQVGDLIEFGSYEQDNDLTNGKETIFWRVIDKRENQVFVISDKVLDSQSYHSGVDRDQVGNVSWTDCSLRTWLNKDFYDEAFTDEEKECIIQVETSEDLTKFHIGNYVVEESYDYVFCLSKTEVKRGVPSAEATPYAEARGLVPVDYGYWLRDEEYAYAASWDGVAESINQEWNNPFVGVRPAMWIELPQEQEQ